MDAIAEIRKRARARVRKIALPEYKDKRVLEALKMIEREKIADAVLVSPDTVDKRENERYIEEFYNSRKERGVTVEDARKTFETRCSTRRCSAATARWTVLSQEPLIPRRMSAGQDCIASALTNGSGPRAVRSSWQCRTIRQFPKAR